MPKYYSTKEVTLRIIWAVVEPVFFRFSPRIFHGWRVFVLRIMGAKIGRRVQIFPSARIMFPWLLVVEDNVVIAWDVNVYNLGLISIGASTVISQQAHLCGGTHDYKLPGFLLLRTGLKIGSGCWIAADAFIGPGVTVGDNSVVAARAVVISDVEPFTLVGGNPARVIRKITEPPRR